MKKEYKTLETIIRSVVSPNTLSENNDTSYAAIISETSQTALAAKAKKSGISIGTLRKVYRRGVAAWNSGHRPGTTPQQWGMARVNSYITKGKGTYYGADKDLHEEEQDPKEYDYEGEMVKSDLRSIMANAKRITDLLEDDDNLPEWCQNKITLAEDYVSTVANYLIAEMNEEVEQIDELDKGERIPRKPGQPAKSRAHSDLYTDENPKGTIHGLKFATPEDAKVSVIKIKNSDRSHAHKIQAAVAMEQRARAAGKSEAAAVYRKYIDSVKKDETNEAMSPKLDMLKKRKIDFAAQITKLNSDIAKEKVKVSLERKRQASLKKY